MKKTVFLSIFLIGFTAMAAQIIFIREFLIVCYGNELSISFILANWLIGGAIGSFIFGRLSDKFSDKISVFSACQIVIGISLPFVIVATRLIRLALGVNPGEIIAFFPIVASSFIILVPVCAILGFMFSLACRIYETRPGFGAESIGRVYILEAVGSMVGGAIVSLILVRLFDSMQIVSMLGILNLSAAFLLIRGNKTARPLLLWAAGLLFGMMLAVWLFNGWGRLDNYSVERQWSGYELIASKNSIYGNITVTRKDEQISFFDNGLHLFTVPDELTSEERVHFALLEHPDPKRVLLIGAGAGGLVREAIEHPIEKLDYVELDPLIVDMARQYLHKADSMPLEDGRVAIINADGRYFIKNTDERYDCVIIALGDPCTAQLNRFYTVEFFREVSKILKKGGVVSFGITSSESYISKELRDLLSSIYATLKKVFPGVLIIPGDTAYFLASGGKDLLTYDYGLLMERAGKRHLNLQYVREYYLFSRMSPHKISYIESSVRRTMPANINYDLRPISYYYDIIYWSSRFRDSFFGKALKAVTKGRLWSMVAVICVFIILFGSANSRIRGSFTRMSLVSVASGGFTSLAFQVLVLVSFQILYGYLFYKLGIILTSFMVGLVLGTLTAIKTIPGLKGERLAFIITQGAVTVYPLALPVFLWFLALPGGKAISWIGSNVIFLLLPIASGFIGAFQFVLANKIYIKKKEGVGRTAGLTYGVDLFGSCLGALLVGAFFIPVLGIPGTCLAIALVDLAVLLALLIS